MALMGTLTVTPEQLKTQSGVVKTELGTMKGYFDELRTLVNGTSRYWIGEAGEVHRKLYTAQVKTIEDMFRRYEEHVTDLEIMGGVYSEAEMRAEAQAEALPQSTL